MAFPEAWASVTSAAEWRNERLCMKIPESLLGARRRFVGDHGGFLGLRHMNESVFQRCEREY